MSLNKHSQRFFSTALNRRTSELVEFKNIRHTLTLSSHWPAVKVYGEKETGYLETHTHLIEILKCIVEKKT